MKPSQFSLAMAAIIASAALAMGQTTTVTTDPVGYVSLTCPAGSDTIISVPLTRPAEYTGAVASVSGSTITLSGSTGWTANQFVYAKGTQPNHYYVLIGPNPVSLVGTVSTTQGSNIITGVGTAFSTAVHVNDVLILNSYSYYTVTAVTSDTSLTVSIAPKATATGVSATVSPETTNPNEGSFYAITANDATSLTVDLKGDTISSVNPGTQVVVTPYWTLATLFPATSAGTAFTATDPVNYRIHQTEILTFNYTRVGVNAPPLNTYYFLNGAWRLFGVDRTVDYGDDVLIPNTYFVVRNPTTAASGTLTIQGGVQSKMLSIPLSSEISTSQDNLVSVARPTNITLNELGLIASGAFEPTDLVNYRNITDRLFVFDYAAISRNKQPFNTYYYWNGHWCLFGESRFNDHGADVIPAGCGFIIRKQPSSQKQVIFWQNTPNYN